MNRKKKEFAVALALLSASSALCLRIMKKVDEKLGDTKTYEALDVTSLLGTDELIQHQNEKVSFKGMTVAASNDAGAPFLYNWDGSGSEGDDLYFNVTLNDTTYTFVVEILYRKYAPSSAWV